MSDSTQEVTFADLGLSEEIVKAVSESGYTVPTPIQHKAIPVVLMGRDVLGCAQTGTGKTASFTLPMIDILSSGRAKARMPRSLIIAPTRELATQVSENFVKYGANSQLTMALLIGGVSFSDQENKLDRGVDVLIATPGRLLDHFERGKVLLNDVKVLVIDEADRMLDMGFIPDVERIVSLLPTIRQTLFFSATMAPEIRRLADKFLMNPKEISVAPPASTAATVKQHLIRCTSKDKRDVLCKLIELETVDSALIFCNRKRDIGVLHRHMKKAGFDVAELHGDMSQPARTATLERFKKGEARLVICSDVAARGLDIKGLSHVFNFDVPSHAEDYVHRIGRTGRAGQSGRAFTLTTKEDGKFLDAITKLIGRKIPEMGQDGIMKGEPLPEVEAVPVGQPADAAADTAAEGAPEAAAAEAQAPADSGIAEAATETKPKRSRGGRGRGRGKAKDAAATESVESEAVEASTDTAAETTATDTVAGDEDAPKPARKPRRSRAKRTDPAASEASTETATTEAGTSDSGADKAGSEKPGGDNVEPFPEKSERGGRRGSRSREAQSAGDNSRGSNSRGDRSGGDRSGGDRSGGGRSGGGRSGGGRSGGRQDGGGGDRVQGFGDEIPAFMLRTSR
jgi:superfamily II DNA/RNA helicase